mmetsp:Transcript_20101/g.49345  ORF Transcript_20101/g.49345 Transcript_20101/m.49345 type:complete len:130 (+) Transcript_20101:35-424(+)
MSSKVSSSSKGGWFNSSSTGKRAVSPSPSKSPALPATSSSSTSISFSKRKRDAMQDLPLDWTRVKRRRAECTVDYNPRTLTKSPLVVSGKEQIHHGYAIFCLHVLRGFKDTFWNLRWEILPLMMKIVAV